MSTISASTTTTTAFGVTADTTGALVFQTGASPTTALTLDTSQNVGIGTSSTPATANYKTLAISGTTGAEIYLQTGSTNYGYIYADNGGFRLIAPASGAATGTMQFSTSNTERMRIDNAGNVGIGTSSPAGRFHVAPGSAASASTAGSAIIMQAQQGGSSAAGGNILIGSGQNGSGGSNGYVAFGIGSITSGSAFSSGEAMRISPNGNVLIGATSQAYPTLGYMLGLQSGGSQTLLSIAKSGQTLDSGGMVIGLDASASYLNIRENIPLTFGTNNTERARIDSSGNLLAYKTMQITTSSSGTYGTATFYTRLTSGTAYTIATGTGLNNDTVVTATLEYVNLYNYTTATDWAYGLRQAALRGSTGGATSAGNNAINNQTNGGAANAPTFLWTGASPISLTVTNSSSVEGWARVTVSWRDVTMSFNPVA